jgi:transposase
MAKPYSEDLRERVVRAVEGDVRATKRLGNSMSA